MQGLKQLYNITLNSALYIIAGYFNLLFILVLEKKGIEVAF